MIKNTVMIGVGTAGCKILSKVNLEINKFFIDTDKNVIEKYSGLQIGKKVCGDFTTNGDVNLGELSVRENKIEILDAIKNFDNLILVTPLGGGTSCGAIRKIIELSLNSNKNIKVITSMPFDFEGSLRLHKAVESICYIEKLCEIVKVNKYDYKTSKENLSLNKIFEKQDEIYLEILDKICV